MINFNIDAVSVEIVQLKTITTSLGGSMSVIDEAKSTDAKEVLKRVVVPMSVAREFIIKTHKVTKYLKPVYVAVVKYGDLIVALERHPLARLGELETEGLFGTKRWIPKCESTFMDFVKPLIEDSDFEWFFDGRYAYTFSGSSIEQAVGEAENLTNDGQFRKVTALTLDFQSLPSDNIAPVNRSCMAFVTGSGDMSISPPIWKNLSDIGSSKMSKASDNDDDLDDDDDSVEVTVNNRYTFDTINSAFAVNLNFALKAGTEIGKTFGYEFVEPLQLSRLMIELHTTNLPNVPKQVKSTYDISMPFTHALAWLLGMSRKANTLETYVTMRSLMKYLTKRGIFKSDVFNANNVFKAGQTVTDVPMLKLEDLIKMRDQPMFSFSDVLEQVNATLKAKRKNAEVGFAFGTLVNE